MFIAGTLCIVVFGTNLTSTVGVKFTRTQLAMVQLAPYQYSVIIGLLLSDGWLRFASKTNKNALLGFKQSLSHSQYVLFVFNILAHYCSSSPRLTSGIRAGNRFYGLEFFTRSMPCRTELHSLFYLNGIKIIPHNIYELLTPVALRLYYNGTRWVCTTTWVNNLYWFLHYTKYCPFDKCIND